MNHYYSKIRTIEYMYLVENKTAQEIADETGYSLRNIRHLISKYGFRKSSYEKESEHVTHHYKKISKEEAMELFKKEKEGVAN